MVEVTEALIRKYVACASEASNCCREPLDDAQVRRIGYLALTWLADSLDALSCMCSLCGAPDAHIASLCRDALPEHTDLSNEDEQVIATAWRLAQQSEEDMFRYLHRDIREVMQRLLRENLTYPSAGLPDAELVELYKLGLLIGVLSSVEDARWVDEE